MEEKEEKRIIRGKKEYIDIEIRKLSRKKLIILNSMEKELLREEMKKRKKKLEKEK